MPMHPTTLLLNPGFSINTQCGRRIIFPLLASCEIDIAKLSGPRPLEILADNG